MMKHRHLSVVLLIVISGISCKKDSAVEPNYAIGIALPLQVGNSWTFKHRVDTSGVVIDSSVVTMMVSEQDTFGTEIGYQISNFLFGVSIVYPGPVIWTNKSDGFYDVVGKPRPYQPDLHRALICPTRVGDSLAYGGYMIRTSAIDEGVTVAAGSFNCIRYDVLQNGSLAAQIYVVPNLGIVKGWQLAFPRSRWVDELQSYHLN